MKPFSVIVSIIILLCCCTRQGAQLPSNKTNGPSDKMDMMTYNKLCIEAEMAEIAAIFETVLLKKDEEKAKEILLESEIEILITLGDGNASATAWGCDLTYDYVKINGDYRT